MSFREGLRMMQQVNATGYAPVNGLQVYYEVHGKSGDKTPLLLLHGGGSTLDTSFGAVLPALAQHRQVIAFDQQGHGRTADVDRPFSFEQTAADAVALLKYLGIVQAYVWGYSNGGHIALAMGLRHPRAVRRLVIESAMFERSGSDPAFWEGFKEARLDEMPAELRKAYRRTAPHPEELQTFFDKSVARMAQFKGWSRDQIRSIRAPALVIIGDHDIVRPEHAVDMFRLLPDAWLAVLPGTDHMTIVKRADWRVSMTEDFLDAPVTDRESSPRALCSRGHRPRNVDRSSAGRRSRSLPAAHGGRYRLDAVRRSLGRKAGRAHDRPGPGSEGVELQPASREAVLLHQRR
jgi:pimeloyl-ACP methyl ester carboxylesterase